MIDPSKYPDLSKLSDMEFFVELKRLTLLEKKQEREQKERRRAAAIARSKQKELRHTGPKKGTPERKFFCT